MQFGLQVNPYVAGGPTATPGTASPESPRPRTRAAWTRCGSTITSCTRAAPGARPVPEPVMECFTTLGAIAAVTRRIRLGQLVLGVPYRKSAMTAKMATTLDLISHGRSILGLGAGWHKREYEAYGWGTFEEVPVRMRRFEEAIRAMLTLWTDLPASFEGISLDHVADLPGAHPATASADSHRRQRHPGDAAAGGAVWPVLQRFR